MPFTKLTATYEERFVYVLPKGVTLLPVEEVVPLKTIEGVEGAWFIKWGTLMYYWKGQLWEISAEQAMRQENDYKYPDGHEMEEVTEEDLEEEELQPNTPEKVVQSTYCK